MTVVMDHSFPSFSIPSICISLIGTLGNELSNFTH